MPQITNSSKALSKAPPALCLTLDNELKPVSPETETDDAPVYDDNFPLMHTELNTLSGTDPKRLCTRAKIVCEPAKAIRVDTSARDALPARRVVVEPARTSGCV